MLDIAVVFCVFAILYRVLGMPVLVIGAAISLVYLYWYAAPVRSPLTIDRFIAADKQLVECVERLQEASGDIPFEFQKISKMINDFVEIYIVCFNDRTTLSDQFSNLVTMRRALLNEIASLQVQGVDYDLTALSACTFKYVEAVKRKYALDYEYPIAANEYGSWDVY